MAYIIFALRDCGAAIGGLTSRPTLITQRAQLHEQSAGIFAKRVNGFLSTS